MIDSSMNEDSPQEPGSMEGRAYTIGREGHIRIDDPSLSRGHAEIRFIGGKIRLRDLGSTNGTFLVASNELVGIDESYVTPGQRVVLGSQHYSVRALLAMAGIFASYSDATGLVVKSANPDQKPVAEKADLDDMVSQAICRTFG
jgi:predicted component of type VI protein secretion system